jgi:hypothetical protein
MGTRDAPDPKTAVSAVAVVQASMSWSPGLSDLTGSARPNPRFRVDKALGSSGWQRSATACDGSGAVIVRLIVYHGALDSRGAIAGIETVDCMIVMAATELIRM